jgi:environmental stress-induced protein Ves
LSSAILTEKSGAFSSFAGYDRWLTLVEGKSLHLKLDGKTTVLKPGDVFHFSGDAAASYELPQGPAKDLSLIFKRGVKAELNIIPLGSKPRSFQLSAQTYLIFVLSGSLSASVYPGELKFSLQTQDTLRVNRFPGNPAEERFLLLEPSTPKASIAVVEISE